MAASEKLLVLLPVLMASFQVGVSQVCPFGWVENPANDACYLLSVTSTKYKFFDAVTKCQSQEAELLIIHTEAEKTWLSQQLQKLSAAFPNAAWWLGMQYQTDSYQWIDGTAVQNNLVPWKAGLPGSTQGPCVVIKDLMAVSSDCGGWYNIICKRSRSIPLSCDVDNEWIYVNGSCFKIFADHRTWHDAKDLCEQQEDAHLATVTTFTEQAELWDRARNDNPSRRLWTGLHVDPQSGQLQLSWLDGTSLNSSQTFWKDGQPGTLQNDTSLVIDGTVQRRLKSWYLTNNSALHSYVCQKPEGVCESGWLTHQSKCFKIFNMNVAWNFANSVCVTTGGELINLASPSDQKFIQRYFPQIRAMGHDSFWIGISDYRNDSGPFRWTDGSVVGNSSHWAVHPPPPNAVGKRDCGYIRTDDEEGRWQMTSDCLQQRTFVCNIPVNTPVHPITQSPTPAGQCETGWQHSGTNCYYLADDVRTWHDAKQACMTLGAHLAIIKNNAEQTFINGMILGADVWIGLSDLQTEGTWVWVDGTPLSGYLHWSKGEPNSQGGNEDCVDLWGTRGESMLGEWNDGSCGSRLRYLCQKPATYNQATTMPPKTTHRILYSAKCGADWEERPNSNYCYQYHDEVKTHADALATCNRYGGSLVSVTDHVEQSYLAGRARSMIDSVVWIGATDSSVEGGWKWVDGAPFAYLNWNPGEPNNINDAEDCGAMFTQTSRWNDFDCRLKMGFICKKIADTYTSTPRPSTTPLPPHQHWSCPTGYIGYNYQCYVTHTTPKSWAEAQQACRTEGAELASLSSQQENEFLFSIIPNGTQAGAWLGMNELQVKGSFTWSDTSPVTFTNWRIGMPISFPSKTCVVMTKANGGTWVNEPCDGSAKYVCKKPMTVSAVTSISPFQVGCPPHSMGFRWYCYHIVATPASWRKAENFCQRSNGHLATINSIAVQSFVMAELDAAAASHYWIGLSDLATPGTYLWSSGEHVLYTAWNSNHTGNENNTCVAMQTNLPIGLWQNLDCDANKYFVCEYWRRGYTSPSTTTIGPSTSPIPCPAGWTGFESNCYKAFADRSNRKSWKDARDFCRSYTADLPSIHSNTVNDFFRSTLLRGLVRVSNFWIGLTDADAEGTYQWSDGMPVEYTKWSPSEPNNAGGNEDCVEYNTYTNAWNDNSCYITNPFICSIPRGKPLVTTLTPPTTTPVATCDGTDWLSKDGYCYYVSPQFGRDATRTWFQARRFCQQNGADLASIPSESVNSFLVQYVSAQEASNRQFWIGFNKLGRRSYEWSDGSPVVYAAWGESEPNDAYGGQSCTNLYSHTGKWNDDNCNDEFHFICKRSNSSVTPLPPVPTPLIHGGCPPGFSGVGNTCFMLGGLTASSALNYTEARDACRALTNQQSTDIASITNHQQQVFLMAMLEGVNSSVYIGLNDMHISKHFVWQDNQEVTVTYWAPNQPSQSWALYGMAMENCVVVRVDEQAFGGWDNVYCGSRHGYVCQTSKDVHYPITSRGDGGCKSGYSHYRDSCYGTYRLPKTWSDAESVCVLDGAHLVSLRDIHELAQVQLFVYDAVIIYPVWIGLSLRQDTGHYAWVDGWPVTLTQWDKGEPNVQNASCVTMNSGVWNDTSCNDTHPFVCKASTVTPPPTTPAPPGYCGEPSWAPHGDFCYYAAPLEMKSWPEANYLCRKLGMELLSLHGADELAFVQSLVNLAISTIPYGFLLNKVEKRVWLGLQRTMEGGFRWSDNSPTGYFSWNEGEPNNMNDEEECAELLVDSGKWNDIACIGSGDSGARGYVCKTPKIIPSTPTPATTPTTLSLSTSKSAGTPSYTVITGHPPFTSYAGGTSSRPNQPGQKTTPGQGVTARSTGNNDSKTLSGGQVAGIVIGLIGFIVIVAAIVFIIRRRRMHQPLGPFVENASGFDNALYRRSEETEEVSLSSNGSTGVSNGSNRIALGHADAEDC